MDRRRFHCLVKAEAWPPIRALYANLHRALTSTALRVSLDLDPVDML